MTYREHMRIENKNLYDLLWDEIVKYNPDYQEIRNHRDRRMKIYPLNRVHKGMKFASEYLDGSGIFILYTFRDYSSVRPDYLMEYATEETDGCIDLKEAALPDEFCIPYDPVLIAKLDTAYRRLV